MSKRRVLKNFTFTFTTPAYTEEQAISDMNQILEENNNCSAVDFMSLSMSRMNKKEREAYKDIYVEDPENYA